MLSTLFPGAAAAQEQPGAAGFLARAVAQGGRFTFGSPGFLIVEDYIDGGGPVAQAVLDSTGSSKAFGSLPYPGELGIAGPGTAAGVAAGFGVEGAKLPNWPFYAGAEHPVTPKAEVADPSGQYALRAAADARSAQGFAQSMFGNDNGSGGGRSESSVKLAEDGTVTAVAETVDEMLSLGGGALTINSVRSRSVTTVAPGAEPVTETALSVTGVGVNGQGAGFAPGDADGAAPLIDTLGQAGITLEVVKAQPVAGGGTADALRITVLGGLPIPGTPQGRVIFSFGGATTSVLVGEAAAEAPAEEEVPAAPAADESSSVAFPRAVTEPVAAATVSRPEAGWPNAPVPAPAPAVELTALPIAGSRALGNGVGLFFVFVAAGAVVLLGAAHLWRKMGVRTPWTF